MDHIQSLKKARCSSALDAVMIFPAVALGVLAMVAEGVSQALWMQQAAAFVVFAILGLLCRSAQRKHAFIWVSICVAALSATLFFPAVGGARRWLDLGIFNVNAGMLLLPSLLVMLGGLKYMYPALIAIAAVLCIQPDFSQLTAFSVSILPLLWLRRNHVGWVAACLVFLGACLIRCAVIPVELEPAAYCEGILAMLHNLSPLMQVIGCMSLALIPICFLVRFFRCKEAGELCLAIYYAVVICFSITGEYPVPFMGFGLSPIAGYWLMHVFTPERDA